MGVKMIIKDVAVEKLLEFLATEYCPGAINQKEMCMSDEDREQSEIPKCVECWRKAISK